MNRSLPIVALAFLALAACEDPAKNKTKAVTGEAAPLTASAAPSAGAVKFDIDPATSKVDWTGSKVTAKHEGSFKSFKGSATLVDGDPEKSSVSIDIDTDSLTTEPAQLVTHLKSGDFFDVAKFPKASFVSTQIKKGGEKGASHTVTGNLTLHGVTKSITFPATVKASPSAMDVDAEFVINRKDYGLVYAGKADDLIRDDVVIKLTIRSKK